jgi:hypothetical protein
MSISPKIRQTGQDPVDALEKIKKNLGAGLVQSVMNAALAAGKIIGDYVPRGQGHAHGGLRRSFLRPTLIMSSPEKATAGAMSDLVYAPIQDEGGTVKSRRSNGWLAVPVSETAKRGTRGWPRQWPKGSLVCIQKKGRDPVLVEIGKGKKGAASMRVHYALKKSVRITGNQYLRRAQPPIIEKTMLILGNYVGVCISRGQTEARTVG